MYSEPSKVWSAWCSLVTCSGLVTGNCPNFWNDVFLIKSLLVEQGGCSWALGTEFTYEGLHRASLVRPGLNTRIPCQFDNRMPHNQKHPWALARWSRKSQKSYVGGSKGESLWDRPCSWLLIMAENCKFWQGHVKADAILVILLAHTTSVTSWQWAHLHGLDSLHIE